MPWGFLLTVQKNTGPSPLLWSHRVPISDLQEAIEEDILCGPLSDYPDFKSREVVTVSMTVQLPWSRMYTGPGVVF